MSNPTTTKVNCGGDAVVLIGTDTPPTEVYVDGLGVVQLGYPNSKLTFVSARDVEEKPGFVSARDVEEKPGMHQVPVLTLTMNTISLMAACNAIIESARINQDFLMRSSKMAEKICADALTQLLQAPSNGYKPITETKE